MLAGANELQVRRAHAPPRDVERAVAPAPASPGSCICNGSLLPIHRSLAAAMTESPGSDLSEYGSEDFSEEVKLERHHSMEPTPDHDVEQRPNKRIRLNNRAPSSPPAIVTTMPPEEEADLSEDTDGSVPASPNHHPGMSQDDDFGQDQVTVCKWEGCQAGDVQNMDNLVEHLHEDHIGTRQKKYSCEWSDCTRKGIPHASGYALRAHMRSHTREKPFYCTLPGMFSTGSLLDRTLTGC